MSVSGKELAKSSKKLTPQQQRVIEYLEGNRTLTNVVALTCLQVGSLSSRVAELRKLGYKITGETRKGHDGRDYMAYDLVTEEG